MALPALAAGLGRVVSGVLPQAAKTAGPDKPGGVIDDIFAKISKSDSLKDNLSGKNKEGGLVKGLRDLMTGLSGDKKETVLSFLKKGIGLDDKAFNAFSTLVKGGNFSDIPGDQLRAAGKFLLTSAMGL